MEYTLLKEGHPDINKPVLVWIMWGHRMQWEIASLHDTNGKDGYQEWIGMGGRIIRVPNQEYPTNLYWSVGGHNAPFDDVIYWTELPHPPRQ